MIWRSTKRLLSLGARDHTTAPAQPAPSSFRNTPPASLKDTRTVLHTPSGDCRLSIAVSKVEASLPSADSTVVKVQSDDSCLVAVFSVNGSAPGLSYLRVKLHQTMQAQVKLRNDPVEAVTAAFASLGAAYRRLHPFHSALLEGVQLTFAFIDLASQTVYLASSGACQAAACSLEENKAVLVCSQQSSLEQDSQSGDIQIQTLPLDSRLDGIVLSSPGLSRELSPAKALLRLQLLAHEAPSANEGNPAAHLTNLALHSVTQRMSKLDDPRMRALSSVSALESLWVGSRANFPGHERMPLRRRRGDVFSCLTSIVIRLGWPGREREGSMCPGCRLYKTVSAPLMGCPNNAKPRPSAAARWDLLRMHFRTFPAAHRQITVQKWHDTVAAAVEADRQDKLKIIAAEALLFGSKTKLPGQHHSMSAWDALVQLVPASA